MFIVHHVLSLLLVSRLICSELSWGRIRHSDQRHEAPSLGHDKPSVLQSFLLFVRALSPLLEHFAHNYLQQQRSKYICSNKGPNYIYIEVSTIFFTTDPSLQRYQWFRTSLVAKVCGWKLILTRIKARCKPPAICWWQIPAVQVWPLRFQCPGSLVNCDYCSRQLAQTCKVGSCMSNTVYGLQFAFSICLGNGWVDIMIRIIYEYV